MIPPSSASDGSVEQEGTFEITGGYGSDWKGAETVTANSHLAGTLVADLVDAAENPARVERDCDRHREQQSQEEPGNDP